MRPQSSITSLPFAPFQFLAATALLAASTVAATANGGYPTPCGSPTTVKARLPPSLNPTIKSHPPQWQPPPKEWLYGNWKITYTSNTNYGTLWNLEFDSYPILPTCNGSHPANCPLGTYPGQNVDLQTWTAANDTSGKILSAFGYDTPRRSAHPSEGTGWDATWDFAATGALKGLANSWELLAYGYDENGDGYIVAYETEPTSMYNPPGIDIESRSETGPSAGTYQAIITALNGLNDTGVDAIVANMTRLTQNGLRKKLPPFVCGPACVNNTGIVA